MYFELCFSFTVHIRNMFVALKTKKIYIIVSLYAHFYQVFMGEWIIGSIWVKVLSKPIDPRY